MGNAKCKDVLKHANTPGNTVSNAKQSLTPTSLTVNIWYEQLYSAAPPELSKAAFCNLCLLCYV